MHLLADAAVGRIAAALRPQLQEMEGFAGIQMEIETHATGEGDGVLRDVRTEIIFQRLVEIARAAQRSIPEIAGSDGFDRFRRIIAMNRRELLPFDGEQAMPLEIAEDRIARQDVETIKRSFEGSSRLVPPVAALADIGGEDLAAILLAHSAHHGEQMVLR